MIDDEALPAAQWQNRAAWDRLVRERDGLTRPAEDADFQNPLATIDAIGWLGGDIRGRRLLCLAAGGGRQSALYAAAGADVTVVDLSSAMLALDREVAAARGLTVRTIQASMDDLPMLAAGEFEIVVQPVSTCYVPDLLRVYREVARVTRAGGLYISQHKQPASLQAELESRDGAYRVVEPYYRTDPLPPAPQSRLRESGTLEYLHRWEQLLGGLCRSGFVLEDLVEPFHAARGAAAGSFAHRACFLPPYVRLKARRTGHAAGAARLVLPGSTPHRPC